MVLVGMRATFALWPGESSLEKASRNSVAGRHPSVADLASTLLEHPPPCISLIHIRCERAAHLYSATLRRAHDIGTPLDNGLPAANGDCSDDDEVLWSAGRIRI